MEPFHRDIVPVLNNKGRGSRERWIIRGRGMRGGRDRAVVAFEHLQYLDNDNGEILIEYVQW